MGNVFLFEGFYQILTFNGNKFNPFLIEVSQFEAVDINTYDDFEMADVVREKIDARKNDKKKE